MILSLNWICLSAELSCRNGPPVLDSNISNGIRHIFSLIGRAAGLIIVIYSNHELNYLLPNDRCRLASTTAATASGTRTQILQQARCQWPVARGVGGTAAIGADRSRPMIIDADDGRLRFGNT